MAPKVTFDIGLEILNGDKLAELAERAKDMSLPFENFIDKWARNNQDKFRASVGAESTGAQVDPTVFWESLKAATSRHKRRLGQPDQIMVATGQLKMELTDEDGFFRAVSPTEALFGAPMSPESEDAVKYNWKKRPVVFLGLTDQKNLQAEVVNYLSFGENYEGILFQRGLENVARTKEVASMDMGFNERFRVPDNAE